MNFLDRILHHGSSECLENILSHSFENLSNIWFFLLSEFSEIVIKYFVAYLIQKKDEVL